MLCESLPTKLELKRNKRIRIQDINLERDKNGEYQTLFPKLIQHKFFEYFRMSKSSFDIIHNGIQSLILKLDTNYRRLISTEERLVVTLM